MPSLIQSLLFLEGVSTTLAGIIAIVSPTSTYKYLTSSDPLGTSTLAGLTAPSSTLTLIQYVGCLFFAFGLPLTFAARDTPSGVGLRRGACMAATAGEAALIPFLAYKNLFEGGGGFDRGMLWLHIMGFAPLLGYRFYGLFVDPAFLEGKVKKG